MDIGSGAGIAIIVLGLLIAPVPISYLVEALRRAPAAPKRLSWAPDIAVLSVEVDGVPVRYTAAGEGPPLVLLHTLRTQLDMFRKMIPELARSFRVIAVDYPGHGYSGIPEGPYTPAFFARFVAGFLDRLGIEDAIIAGESIGGSIALLLAAEHNPRVARVIAINPYDYDRGRGLRRSSLLANLFFALNNVPVLGATFSRLRQFPVVKRIFEGGVQRRESLPPALVREMHAVGNRRGHYRAFMSLVHHWPDWEAARARYPHIRVPVLLLYGDNDWSRPDERAANLEAIPGAVMALVAGARHFLSLDAPDEAAAAIREFAGATALQPQTAGAPGLVENSAPKSAPQSVPRSAPKSAPRAAESSARRPAESSARRAALRAVESPARRPAESSALLPAEKAAPGLSPAKSPFFMGQ